MVLEIMKCLSDSTRLRILTLLSYRKSPMCVGDVVESLDLPQYAISKHLKRMQEAGILRSFKKTQYTYYEMNDAALKEYPFLNDIAQVNLNRMAQCRIDIDRMENIV